MNRHPGVGVMIHQLWGSGQGGEAVDASKGKVIAALQVFKKELLICFTDNTELRLMDDGQSCCEFRYMTTDDSPEDHVGATFLNAETRDGENVADIEEHEIQFLIITTTAGALTVANHNEHNGYYGGFWITARVVDTKADDQ